MPTTDAPSAMYFTKRRSITDGPTPTPAPPVQSKSSTVATTTKRGAVHPLSSYIHDNWRKTVKISSKLHRQRSFERGNFRLMLPASQFICCWWGVFLFHAMEVVFLTCMVGLYYWLLHQQHSSESLLQNVTFYITFDTLDKMNWCFALMAVAHLLVLLWNCYVSIKARKIYFGDPSRRQPPLPPQQQHDDNNNDNNDNNDNDQATSLCFTSTVYCYASSMNMIYEYAMANWLEPVFYIHGKYFDYYFLFRELTEVAAQLYQAYQMSVYIATRWINNLFVGMIFLNCVSTPIIHRVVSAENMPLRRLMSVTTSTFLNFINAVVVPLIIFYKYFVVYNRKTQQFPAELMWDDVWYVKAVHENQQLLVTSILDFVTTLTPHWSLMSCLRTFQGLVRREEHPILITGLSSLTMSTRPIGKIAPGATDGGNGDDGTGAAVPAPAPAPAPVAGADAPRITSAPSISMVTSTKPIKLNSKNVCERTLHSIVCNLLLVCGLLAACFHVFAQWQKPEIGCKLIATPWFTRRVSCVVMEVSCERYAIDGNETALQKILQPLNGNTMVTLVISHCPRLQMPPAIRQFHQLSTFEIYNCTIDKWSLEASARAEDFPRLVFLNVIRSNLSSIPPGLMDSNVPSHQTLFRETNLTTLPDTLHESWTGASYVGFEFCLFQQIPSTLYHLQQEIEAMTFLGNPIAFLPDNESLEYPSMYSLCLSETNLTRLPNMTIANLGKMQELYLESTQLHEVPLYLREWYLDRIGQVSHSLFGSPYCDRQFDANDEEFVYQSQVCQEDLSGFVSWYPMDLMESQRQIQPP